MINFKPGQFLEFKDTVAKVTKVGDGGVKMQKASYGRTDDGYIFQHTVSLRHLRKLADKNAIRIIPWDEVLMTLFRKLKVKGGIQK